MRRCTGFTLVELVLTVVLTGIIASMLVVVTKQPLEVLWSFGDTLNRQGHLYLALEDLSAQLNVPIASLTLKSEDEKDTLTVQGEGSSLRYECDRNNHVMRKTYNVTSQEKSGLLFKKDSCFFELQEHPRGWTVSIRIEKESEAPVFRRMYVPR